MIRNIEIINEVIRLHNLGLSRVKIAKSLELTEGQVRTVLKHNKLVRPKPRSNLFGQRINMLKVVDNGTEKRNKDGRKLWKCLCDCGNICYRNTTQLNPTSRWCVESCGCKHYKIAEEHSAWTGYGEIPGRFLCRAKHGAKIRDLEFNVSIEYLWDLFLKQERKCVYSGQILFFGKTRKDFEKTTASLDRIDASKGYIEGNVQFVHKDINVMKWDFTEEEFLNYCTIIADYKRSKI